MSIGIIGTSNLFNLGLMEALYGLGNNRLLTVNQNLFPWLKKQKTRKLGQGNINQRQLRKRVRQGCKIRQECRLKQRRS